MPVPQYKTACGWGFGLAACPSLGLLVTSDNDSDTLSVWSIPGGCSEGAGTGGGRAGGLARVCTLGGKGSPAPMQFKFWDGEYSGYLAFTPRPPDADTPHLLLVTDAGQDAVHIVDVRGGGAHVGYLAAPGSIAGPRGVAASRDLVAVSAWKRFVSDDHVVHIYRAGSGVGAHWTHVRAIGGGFGRANGQLQRPRGLRFSGDGSAICVADQWNDRVSLFRVGDGGFVRHIATGLMGPRDVEEMEGGWLVACRATHAAVFVTNGEDDSGRRPFLGRAGDGSGREDGEFLYFATWALVPGLGLVAREYGNGGRFQVFSTPDILAMRAMSAIRVGWMTATYRAAVKRQFLMVAKTRLE